MIVRYRTDVERGYVTQPDTRVPHKPRLGIYWSLAGWAVMLGLFLILAPDWFYGPSWSYFTDIPHNGLGLGICLIAIGIAELITLEYGRRIGVIQRKVLTILFFLGGFVFWTAGIILGAEGLSGHQGLMEAPFMLYVGAHKIAYSASMLTSYRLKKHLDDWVSNMPAQTMPSLNMDDQ